MLKNYFTTAINNLLKNKLYSAINIIGLAVGLAACILITLYVRDELSYDKHWEKADFIYRVNNIWTVGNSPKQISPATALPALPALKKFFLEDIELGTRIWNGIPGVIQVDNKQYPGSIPKVDQEFIKIFQCKALYGSLEKTLQVPGNIALSEDVAIKYFGDKDPIGEMITFIPGFGNKMEVPYRVTAVYRFISPNTILNIPGFSLLDTTSLQAYDWGVLSPETYIRFTETADMKKFVSRLPDFVNQAIPGDLIPGKKTSDIQGYSLQKISEIYFNPISSPFPQNKTGNKNVITVFIIISLVVLIMGCINSIILCTAKATQRAREVAMRKVVGARFRQLFIQFLGESVLITLLSFILAIALIELTLPVFEMIVDKNLKIPYSSTSSIIFVLLSVTFVGLLGGFYPALVLAGFSPSRALKASQSTESNSFKLKNILVVFQFTASVVLIISTVVAYFQMQYINRHDPGFNPDKLLVVGGIGRPEITKNMKITLQQELIKLSSVYNVSLSTQQPNLVELGTEMYFGLRRKTGTEKEINYNNIFVDYDFLKAYEISLLSGRFFARGMDHEESINDLPTSQSEYSRKYRDGRIIINLAAAIQLGFASANEAIGEIIIANNNDPVTPYYSEYTIIGVVEDSQFRNLRIRPEPEVYRLSPGEAFFLTVRYKGDYPVVINEVERVWNAVMGDFPVKVSSVRQNLSTTFLREEKESKVLISFAMLAIFIACMGLFGMASFTVDRRIKEIGMRKVMGAKVKDIVKLLGWQFLKPVLIANIIAWPVAIFAMQNWLERFPYRFNPLFMIPICLGSGFIALVIAWLTVVNNTTRVARSKPIKALRYE